MSLRTKTHIALCALLAVMFMSETGGAVSWKSPGLGSIGDAIAGLVGYKTGIKDRFDNVNTIQELEEHVRTTGATDAQKEKYRTLVHDAEFYNPSTKEYLTSEITATGINITIEDREILELNDNEVKQLLNLLIRALKGEIKDEYKPIAKLSKDKNYTYIIDIVCSRSKITGRYYNFVLRKSGNKPANVEGLMKGFDEKKIKQAISEIGSITSRNCDAQTVRMIDYKEKDLFPKLRFIKWESMIDNFRQLINEQQSKIQKLLPQEFWQFSQNRLAMLEVTEYINAMKKAYNATSESEQKNFVLLGLKGSKEENDVIKYNGITIDNNGIKELFNLIVASDLAKTYPVYSSDQTKRYNFHWTGRRFDLATGVVIRGEDS